MGLFWWMKNKVERVMATDNMRKREITVEIGGETQKFNLYGPDTLEVDGQITVTQKNHAGAVVRQVVYKLYDLYVSKDKPA